MTDFTPTPEQEAIRSAFRTGGHLAVQAGAGTGKALRDDQNVMTPDGPRPIGTIKVGDVVLGSTGAGVPVTGVYPQGVRPLYTVTTSDGVQIVADAEHRWQVRSADLSLPQDAGRRSGQAQRRIATTQEIAADLEGGMAVFLPLLTAPAHFHAHAGVSATSGGTVIRTGPVWDSEARRFEFLRRATEGAVGGHVTVPSAEAATIAEVARSLGGVAEIRSTRTPGHSVVRTRFPENQAQLETLRRIVSVVPAEAGPATCISVDSPDHLYVTEGFVLTHNTSTVRLLAEDLFAGEPNAAACYIAFNRAIADEMSSAVDVRNFQASTVHSMVWRAWKDDPDKMALLQRSVPKPGSKFADSLPPWEVPSYLGVKHPLIYKVDAKARPDANHSGTDWIPGPADLDGISVALDPDQLCTMATLALTRWCHSDRAELSARDVQRRAGMSREDHDNKLVPVVLGIAQKMWAQDLTLPDGRLKFTHDYYLKMWALERPNIVDLFMPWASRGVLFFDEAQDCQPEGTKVLTPDGMVPIETLKVGDRVVSYTPESCRLRLKGSPVTSVSSRAVDEDVVRVRTQSGRTSVYTGGHICLARIGPALTGKTVLYAMRRGQSWRVGVTSQFHGKNRSSSGLGGRLREEDGDAIWILDVFDSKADALLAEAAIPARFGVPDVRFIDNGQRSVGQERLDGFWDSFGDLTDSAINLLSAYGRDVNHPIATRTFSGAGSRVGYLLYSRAATVRACNLLTGMEVLDVEPLLNREGNTQRRFDDSAWTPIEVSRERLNGPVWSVEVADDHTYVGDGIVTHNCNPVMAGLVNDQLPHMQVVTVGDSRQAIYGFRGVVDHLDAMGGKPGVTTLPLTKSWRFGPAVATLANLTLDMLPGDFQVVGNDALPSMIVPVLPGGTKPHADAIITRSNKQMITELLDEIAHGRSVYCQVNTSEVERICKDVAALRAGRKAQHQDMKFFRSLAELEAHVKDPTVESSPIIGLVRTVLEVGEDTVSRAMKSTAKRAEDADVTISTIHKAKGMEWDRVRIVGDPDTMLPLGPDSTFPAAGRLRESLMLLYVAITRAKQVLYIDAALHERLTATTHLLAGS